MPRRTRRGYIGSNWVDDRTKQLPLSRETGRHRKEKEGCEKEICESVCMGDHCPDYCNAIVCPPGNSNANCSVACDDTTYYTCASTASALVALAFMILN